MAVQTSDDHKTKESNLTGKLRDCAIVLVDCQLDFYTKDKNVSTNFPEMPNNMAKLLKYAREEGAAEGLKVVHVREVDVDGESKWIEWYRVLHPEFELSKPSTEKWAEKIDSEELFIKRACDGFLGTGLDKYLRESKIKKLYFCGLLTHACVLNTFLSAFNHGYHVYLVTDCCGGRKREYHDQIIAMFDGYILKALTHEQFIDSKKQ
mmetsp:Transcript_18960/g.30186  ORF Transcript_18960/g.30186 Transcript_18960/m.30186 type:complete len:207 (-) Transcript_18960:70-690(-)